MINHMMILRSSVSPSIREVEREFIDSRRCFIATGGIGALGEVVRHSQYAQKKRQIMLARSWVVYV